MRGAAAAERQLASAASWAVTSAGAADHQLGAEDDPAWGLLLAAYGDNLMAAVRREPPFLAAPNVAQGSHVYARIRSGSGSPTRPPLAVDSSEVEVLHFAVDPRMTS